MSVTIDTTINEQISTNMIPLRHVIHLLEARRDYYLDQYNQTIKQIKERNGGDPGDSNTAQSFDLKVNRCNAALDRVNNADFKILTIGELNIVCEELQKRLLNRNNPDWDLIKKYHVFLNN